MISSSKQAVAGAKFSPRVIELRKKIHDANYIDFAVQRIAQVLSRKIVEDNEHHFAGGLHESK